MTPRPLASRAARRRQLGFTLMTVLIAIFLFGIGLLGILRSIGNVTKGATQNQNVMTTATLSNAFWGVIQANPGILTDPAMPATGTPITFSASNITSAPTALRPWLYSLVDTGVPGNNVPGTGLPGGTATITTSPDAGSGATCSATTACSVTLTLTWSVGSGTTTRQQTFYYQLFP